MAIPAHHERFPMLGNHCDFPPFLAFEIFEFVNVVNLVMVALCRSTQLTDLCFQPVFKGIDCISVDNSGIADVIRSRTFAFTVSVICEVTSFVSQLRFIGDTPFSCTIIKLVNDFGKAGLML